MTPDNVNTWGAYPPPPVSSPIHHWLVFIYIWRFCKGINNISISINVNSLFLHHRITHPVHPSVCPSHRLYSGVAVASHVAWLALPWWICLPWLGFQTHLALTSCEPDVGFVPTTQLKLQLLRSWHRIEPLVLWPCRIPALYPLWVVFSYWLNLSCVNFIIDDFASFAMIMVSEANR